MQATFIFADIPSLENSSRYRIKIPAKYLSAREHDINIVHIRDVWNPNVTIAATVLVERAITPELINHLRARGAKRIVCTFDDAYHLIPRSQTNSFEYWRGDGRHVEVFRDALAMCEAVIVPSEELAKDYSALYVPNYHDPDLWEFEAPEKLPGISIGWGGSVGHMETWAASEAMYALKRITDEFREVEVHIYGFAADTVAHATGLTFTRHEWMPFHHWPVEIAKWHIGVAPMTTAYDLRRSNLKLIEYGLAGIPFVADFGGPYRGVPGGFLVENRRKDWYRALAALVRSEKRRSECAVAGRAWSKQYLMHESENIEKYEEILWPH